MSGITLMHRSLLYMLLRTTIYFFCFLYVLGAFAFSFISQFIDIELIMRLSAWFLMAWVTYYVLHDRRGQTPSLSESLSNSIHLFIKGWWLLLFLVIIHLMNSYVYYVLDRTTGSLLLYLAGLFLQVVVPFLVLPLLQDDITRCVPVMRYCFFELKHGWLGLLVFFMLLIPLWFVIAALVGSVFVFSSMFFTAIPLFNQHIYPLISPTFGNYALNYISSGLLLCVISVAQAIFYQSLIYGRD